MKFERHHCGRQSGLRSLKDQLQYTCHDKQADDEDDDE
jgi:hypothetical protein